MVGKRHIFLNSKKSTLAFVGFYNSEAAEMLKLTLAGLKVKSAKPVHFDKSGRLASQRL